MTHIIYSQQQLQLKSIARLKQIYSEIACTVEVSDKRSLDSWISAIASRAPEAIAEYQSSKVQKLTPAAPDNQAQPVAPEKLTTVEISFYDHEYYAGDKLIASITYDDTDFVTQRWVVTVNNKEVHRTASVMLCHRYICSHYKDGSLPVQEQNATETPCPTGNEIMAQVCNECEKYGFEILGDGIYQNNVKLGEVGCTDGGWWVMRECQQQPCDSAMEAVWWLSMVDISTEGKSIFDEYFLEQLLEQLTGDKLQRLLERAELVTG
jgi:hypothetical protein